MISYQKHARVSWEVELVFCESGLGRTRRYWGLKILFGRILIQPVGAEVMGADLSIAGFITGSDQVCGPD